MENKKILVLGIGNKYRCDDGAGIAAAEMLEQMHIENFDVKTLDGEGAKIIESWNGYDDVVIIDAVKKNGSAGNIYEINANEDELKSDFFNYSSHAFGLAEAINISKVMNRLPKKLTVYGIEGKSFNFDTKLTPKIEKAAAKTAQIIKGKYSLN
ncbi:MAG: hydrogenase maturation protease [Bacteroidetes bacterium]|nr:hydrogenase maturation protease [Bacteroidota bacterium]